MGEDTAHQKVDLYGLSVQTCTSGSLPDTTLGAGEKGYQESWLQSRFDKPRYVIAFL